MLALLVVGGIGAVHLAISGMVQLAVLASVVTILGCVSAARRLTVLRTGPPTVPTWEPMVLTVAGCLLALSVLTVV
jgi:hypothetical protein